MGETSTTSHDAHEQSVSERAYQRDQVLNLLQVNSQGLTGPEVDYMLNDGNRGHHHKRLPELATAGMVHTTGVKRRPFYKLSGKTKGHEAMLYFAGPHPNPPAPRPPTEPTDAELQDKIVVAERSILLWRSQLAARRAAQGEMFA